MKRREQIERMLQDDPNDGFLNYALALEVAAEGNLGQAIDLLQKLIKAQPDYIPAYLQAGQFLVKQGDLTVARDVLTNGMAAARVGQDEHAAEEMANLLASISS